MGTARPVTWEHTRRAVIAGGSPFNLAAKSRSTTTAGMEPWVVHRPGRVQTGSATNTGIVREVLFRYFS